MSHTHRTRAEGMSKDELIGELVDAFATIAEQEAQIAHLKKRRPPAGAQPTPDFVEAFNAVAAEQHAIAVEHGWWESKRNFGELVALMHSELSEALEAERHGNPQSDHIPSFSGVEEEFADVIIRIMDAANGRGLRVAEALLAKMEFNRGRPHRHGGKTF